MRKYAVADLLSRASFLLKQAPMTQSFAGALRYLEWSFLLELEEILAMPHPYRFLHAESTNYLTSDY